MMSQLTLSDRSTKAVMASLLTLNVFAFFSIPFQSITTLFLLLCLLGVYLGFNLDYFKRTTQHRVSYRGPIFSFLSSRMGVILNGAAMASFMFLINYNAVTDMEKLTSYPEMDNSVVATNTVVSTLRKYPKGDPARVMLTQFFLTSPHSTTFVWNKVAYRAQELSALYQKKELPDNAAVPYYGFLNLTKNAMSDVIMSRTNKLPLSSKLLKLRRKGYSVRYANAIVRRVSDVVMGKSGILNNVGSYSEFLASINTKEDEVEKVADIASMAKQLGIKTSLPDLVNSNLGRHLSTSDILNAALKHDK